MALDALLESCAAVGVRRSGQFWVYAEKSWSSCTTEYFEMQELIDTLDVALNFQMHQLTLTATHEDAKRRCINVA